MDIKSAVIGGAIGGAIGAIIWAAVGFFTGYEVGWVAWGVGLLTGIGVRSALANRPCKAAGLVAAAIAFGAVLGGKFAVAHLGANRIMSELAIAAAEHRDYSRDEVLSYMCAKLVEQYESQGQLFEWPEGIDPDDAYLAEHYPEPIVNEAVAAWDGMSSAEQGQYKAAMNQAIIDQVRGFSENAGQSFFLASFSPFDVLWIILALSTAFKVATDRNEAPSSTEPEALPQGPQTAESSPSTGWRWPAASDQAVDRKSA